MAELVEEIFLRIPPDDPAAFVRASFVCKSWRRLLSDPAFGRRYRAFYRAPPLLGFLHQHHAPSISIIPRFVPTVTPSPLPQRALDAAAGSVLDCRHGRVLFGHPVEGVNLVVWYPVTGEGEELPEPRIFLRANNAAVLCAVRGCDHLDCQGGPFVVVVVGYGKGNKGMQSHLYSSEKDAWIASAELGPGFHIATRKPSVLIGDDIYFLLTPLYTILKYSFSKNFLSMIHSLAEHDVHGGIALMPMEDGSLGLAGVLRSKECSRLCLWSRNPDPEVVAGWVQFRVIDLEPMAPIPFRYSSSVKVAGSAEGFSIIFVTTDVGVFTIELKSGHVKKVGTPGGCFTVFPFMSFCAPGILLALCIPCLT
ncbi:hypothetical protein HU200_027972 [Digitaria exilis]|uniref:F-box domain-containing protein n=1 Tax=Digitaria exilis TaxID=1010633 RepID=A0A835BSN2_9POAL|nr:hypothetical protein HU200_027972 [Digitaria exilis]